MTKPPSNINPGYKRNPAVEYSIVQCVEEIQNYKILSYLISKAESTIHKDNDFVSQVISQCGQSRTDTNKTRRVAVSGSPGVGKSTFINSIGQMLTDQNKKIAILPVDPSSHISKGSILGDKTRMEDLMGNENVYIKPMASSLSLGGVAPATQMAALLCECAQFDYVFIETVGVGQSEYEVRHLVDLFLLLLQPGGGDDLQGIKRGIMEMADFLIVTKADGALKSNAQFSFDAYSNALKLMLPNKIDWKTKIKMYSSMSGEGGLDLLNCLDKYFEFLHQEDRFNRLRKEQNAYLFDKSFQQLVFRKFENNPDVESGLNKIKNEFLNNEILLFQAKENLKRLIDEV